MRIRSFVASVLILMVLANGSVASAKWGCAVQTTDGRQAIIAHVDTKAEAMADAMDGCTKQGGAGCHIIGCNPHVDSISQGSVVWPAAGHASNKAGYYCRNGHCRAARK